MLYFFARHCFGHESYQYGENIVHGPFNNPIIKDSKIYFSKSQDSNYPVYLVLEKRDATPLVVDQYPISGSNPHIVSAFFFPVKEEDNLFVILRWELNNRGLGTYGNLYEIHAYHYIDGKLSINKLITSNPDMNGMDGYIEGVQSIFKLKTASDVKAYIKKNL